MRRVNPKASWLSLVVSPLLCGAFACVAPEQSPLTHTFMRLPATSSLQRPAALLWVAEPGGARRDEQVGDCEADQDGSWVCYFDHAVEAEAGALNVVLGDAGCDAGLLTTQWESLAEGTGGYCAWPVQFRNSSASTGDASPTMTWVDDEELVAAGSVTLEWEGEDRPVDGAWLTFEETDSGIQFAGWVEEGVVTVDEERCRIYAEQADCRFPDGLLWRMGLYLEEGELAQEIEGWSPVEGGATLTTDCTDADGDGYCVEGGDDCDDVDGSIHPGAYDAFNRRDDDCDGWFDERSFAAGSDHTLAVAEDGTVWAWGANGAGQLGNDTTTESASPVQVAGLTDVIAVAAGYLYSLALDKSGRVWAWGKNDLGQLGNGTLTDNYLPEEVLGLPGVIAVSAGGRQSLALDVTGAVWQWGEISDTGDPNIDYQRTPTKVADLSGVVSIATGDSSYVRFSLALDDAGTVWAWGNDNEYGNLGTAAPPEGSVVPVQVAGLSDITAIAAAWSYALALDENGVVWAWGYNFAGLGDGIHDSSSSPVEVAGLSGVVALSTGMNTSLALDKGGKVWAWGANSWGNFGDGTTIASPTPIETIGLTSSVVAIDNEEHSLALDESGTVYAWGYNYNGQLVPLRHEIETC